MRFEVGCYAPPLFYGRRPLRLSFSFLFFFPFLRLLDWTFPSILKLIKRIVYKDHLYKNLDFDVIHVHVGTPAIPYLGLIESINGIKRRVFHCHCSERKMSFIGNIQTKISRILMDKTYTREYDIRQII